MKRQGVLWVLTLACAATPVLAGANLIDNPGLEDSSNVWQAGRGLDVQAANEAQNVHTGQTALHAVAGAKDAPLLYRQWRIATAAKTGATFRLSFWAKGKGALAAGYEVAVANKGVSEPDTWWGEAQSLSDQWRQYSVVFSCPRFDIHRVFPAVKLAGAGDEAWFDDFEMVELADAAVSIDVRPGHVIKTPGAAAKVQVLLTREGKPMSGVEASVLLRDRVVQARADDAGRLQVELALDSPDMTLIQLPQPYHNTRPVAVDVIDAAQFQRLDELASRLKLSSPQHVLFLGDSLSDWARGENYIDKLAFWLSRHNPGMVSVRNAGVGGDYITRMLERMTRPTATTYRPEMYKDLFVPKPDWVFIFLGHNDTKVTSVSNYQKPIVDPQTQQDAYLQVIQHIRANCDARIVLLSPASSDYEVCRQNADKLSQAGKRHNLFGVPEQLESFDRVLRQLASAQGTHYLDVYTPTKNHPRKADLFKPADGVHLSPAGQQFLAELLLNASVDLLGNKGS